MKYQIVDLDNWERKNLYAFYSTFDCPCFSLTFKIKCQKVWEECKKDEDKSFFLYCFYYILNSLNSIENFRYRVHEGKVVLYEKCNAVCAIDIGNDLFEEVEFEYFDDMDEFFANSKKIIKRVKEAKNVNVGENDDNQYIVSCVPWLEFESYTPAQLDFKQAAPHITFGKYKDGEIPLTIKANHCFVDGMHIRGFISNLERLLEPVGTGLGGQK